MLSQEISYSNVILKIWRQMIQSSIANFKRQMVEGLFFSAANVSIASANHPLSEFVSGRHVVWWVKGRIRRNRCIIRIALNAEFRMCLCFEQWIQKCRSVFKACRKNAVIDSCFDHWVRVRSLFNHEDQNGLIVWRRARHWHSAHSKSCVVVSLCR